ncbi:MAG TPA: hypothetical protein VLA29_08145 [Acidimicrobiia bacterium]|nr:hypothetical protein [Acidimicrobiia bacterium]
MIPSLIAFGLIFGRWWKPTLTVGVVGWVVVLLVTDIITWHVIPAAAAFALVNTAVGVLAHQGGLRVIRAVRSRGEHPETA